MISKMLNKSFMNFNQSLKIGFFYLEGFQLNKVHIIFRIFFKFCKLIFLNDFSNHIMMRLVLFAKYPTLPAYLISTLIASES